MAGVVDEYFFALLHFLAYPGEGFEDVFAGGLAVHAILVISEKDSVFDAANLVLGQVVEDTASLEAGLRELAFLVEIVDSHDDGTVVRSEWANPR